MRLSEQDIQAFERKLAAFQYTEFSGGTRNFLRTDVPAFIAAVRQMLTPTQGHLEPEVWADAADKNTA